MQSHHLKGLHFLIVSEGVVDNKLLICLIIDEFCILDVKDSVVESFQGEESLPQLLVGLFKWTVQNNEALSFIDCLLRNIIEDVILQIVNDICFFEIGLEQQLSVADEVIGELVEKTMPIRVELNQDVIEYLFVVKDFVFPLP